MRSWKSSARAVGSVVAASGLAMAVGVTGNGTAIAASTPHWRVVHRNHRSVDNAFTGVLAFSPANAWAIGQKIGNDPSFVMRWNGKSWRSVPLPVSDFGVGTIAASGRANVWITGYTPTGSSEILRWDGQWHVMTPPPSLSLGELAVLGPSEALVIGDSSPSRGATNVWLWDGAVTTDYPVPTVLSEDSISESSSGRVWAVGPAHGSHTRARAYTWTGSGWARVKIPVVHGSNTQVVARTDHDVWIQGFGSKPNQHGRYPRIFLHWNGKRWRRIWSPWWASSPMAPDGHGGVWAGKSAHWTHGHWIQVYPYPPHCVATGFNFLAAVPHTHSVWAVSSCQRTRKSLTQGIISVTGRLP